MLLIFPACPEKVTKVLLCVPQLKRTGKVFSTFKRPHTVSAGMEFVNSISGFLQRARGFFAVVGYVRKNKITNGQRQLQKLQSQVYELSRRLQCIQAMTGAVGVELSSPGPFLLPLLKCKSVLTEVEDELVMELELPDGKQIYARMPYLAAAQLVNSNVSLPLRTVTVNRSASIHFKKSADAFRLPFLVNYEGHFFPDRGIRVLIFLTQDGRRVFFPLSTDIYENLLRQFQAALVDYRQSKIGEVGLGLRLACSLRYRR